MMTKAGTKKSAIGSEKLESRRAVCFTAISLVAACLVSAISAAPPELHVAAASNLTAIMPELDASFERATGIHVVPSFGASAQLAQQIQNGAPFDLFLSADVEHVDVLVKSGAADPATKSIYARGRLVVWAPMKPGLRNLAGLANPDIRTIAIAKPELAPYGEAAVDSLKSAGLWPRAQAKAVYAPNISTAKQFADTGNADAAFTALALVIGTKQNYFEVEERLHSPIDQALCIVKSSPRREQAQAFASYLKSPAGRAILMRFGYAVP